MTGVVIKEENNTFDSSYYSVAKERRKRMKVAVERRRRDRINRALESLRHLLAEDTHTDVEADQVIDKAVILEKTVQLLQRNRNTSFQPQGAIEQSISPNHYAAGYLECLQQIDNATNQSRMDSHMKSRLLNHLSRNQNIRMVPYTKRSIQESYASQPVSPLHIHPVVHGTTSPSPTNCVSSRTSSVHYEYSQLHINTNSSAQDLSRLNSRSVEVAPVGLLLQRAPSSQVPANPHPQGHSNRTAQAVDENNNVVNPIVPAPASSPVWRPW